MNLFLFNVKKKHNKGNNKLILNSYVYKFYWCCFKMQLSSKRNNVKSNELWGYLNKIQFALLKQTNLVFFFAVTLHFEERLTFFPLTFVLTNIKSLTSSFSSKIIKDEFFLLKCNLQPDVFFVYLVLFWIETPHNSCFYLILLKNNPLFLNYSRDCIQKIE